MVLLATAWHAAPWQQLGASGVGVFHSVPRLHLTPRPRLLCNCLDERRGSSLCPRNKIKECSQAEGRHTFIAISTVDACKPSLCKYSWRPTVSQPNPSMQSVGSTSVTPAAPRHAPHHPASAAQATAPSGKSYAKHTVALAFSVQTVSPVLHTVIKNKGAKVLNLGFSTRLYCRSLKGHWQNHCVSPPLGSPWLWGAHQLGLV